MTENIQQAKIAKIVERLSIILLIANCFLSSPAWAVQRQSIFRTKARTAYHTNPELFKREPALPLSDKSIPVSISDEMFESRLKVANSKNPKLQNVEPITIFVPKDETKRFQFINQVAKVGFAFPLYAEISKNGVISKETEDQKTLVYTFTPETIKMLNRDKYLEMNRKIHHALTLDSRTLAFNNKANLFAQIKPFLSKNKLQRVKRDLMNGARISVDNELLPEFPTRVIGHHTAYRGPNCFHAALAFQGMSIVKSPNVNVKEEQGYHPSMINFDELWRVLKNSFYEINPEQTTLKYGDMVVFFDLPEGAENRPVNFHWIRHASTHLFDGYVFSKGSKSANTPYVVRTLSEEWGSWKAFSKNLAVKVFRRSAPRASDFVVNDLAEWND